MVNCLVCSHEDPSSTPRTHMQKARHGGMAVIPPALERQRREDLFHSQTNKLSLLSKLQTKENVVSKNMVDGSPLSKDAKGRSSGLHMHPRELTHILTHKHTSTESFRIRERGRPRPLDRDLSCRAELLRLSARALFLPAVGAAPYALGSQRCAGPQRWSRRLSGCGKEQQVAVTGKLEVCLSWS